MFDDSIRVGPQESQLIKKLLLVTFAYILGTFSFPVLAVKPAAELIQKIDKARISVSEAEATQRKLTIQVEQLNRKIKEMSTQRAKINDKMLDSQGSAQELAFEVREWESKVREQRQKIGKYLGQIYQLQNPSIMTFAFSGQGAGEIERNLKFLKLLSERDHKFFLTFQDSLTQAKQAREKLKSEVRDLLNLRRELIAKESDLIKEQKDKGQLIKTLRKNADQNLRALKHLRSRLPEMDQKTEVAIFEKRGALASPLPSQPTELYGTQFDPVYRTKLLHLGWSYNNLIHQPVRAIFGGKVKFSGRLPGYGVTVVIDHGDHYYSIYAHNEKALAFDGEQIFEGQMVAQSSQSLYFELRHFANALDPEKWIDKSSLHKMAIN